MAKKFTKEQWIGIFLIIAALLIWVPLPSVLSSLRQLGPAIVVIIGLWKLFLG